MSHHPIVDVNTYYTRSINLERDADSDQTVQAYIPTSRSLQTLARFAKGLSHEAIPRAWALTGPYGAGKSMFAIFLRHLLDSPTHPNSQLAQQILGQNDQALAAKFQHNSANQRDSFHVLLTGSPAPLGKKLLQALTLSTQQYWQDKHGQKPKIVKQIKAAAKADNYPINDIIELIIQLQTVLHKHSNHILIVIDELGKFLEYEARHTEVNDIYLLQSLAELSQQANTTPIHLVVLLHQSFEQYARGLGERLKNEWQKIQGRFESIAFIESSEQILRVLQKAIIQQQDLSTYPRLQYCVNNAAKILNNSQALPNSLSQTTAQQLFLNCYPLHPITLLLLPILCQRVAQNERTLFSYLGSQEPHGFKTLINELDHNEHGWIMPWQLYDYFILNQPASLTDPLTQRRWAEVITAVERLGNAPVAQIKLLKTIGLFNIIGSHGSFKASPEIIQLCETNTDILTALSNASIITYQKFNHEYRVWQGSDFDREAVLQQEIQQLGRIDLAEQLNQAVLLLPLIARRHSFKTGTLRYFQPTFIDTDNVKLIQNPANSAPLMLCLSETEEDTQWFLNQNISVNNLFVIITNGEQLRELTTEVSALKRMQSNQQALHADPVALHEFNIHLSGAEQRLKTQIKDIIRLPQTLNWYWQHKPLPITSVTQFQKTLSQIMDHIYAQTPWLKNELINRNTPSTSASSGRNRLLTAMLEHADEADLAIKKFPSEKSIYRSILKASGLHRCIDDNWQFSEPFADDPCHLMPVWQEIQRFIKQSEQTPVALTKLLPLLSAAPYGVTAGVNLILIVTTLLVHKNELALYEEGNFIAHITTDVLERLRADINRFSIQYFKIEGVRASLFNEYVKLLAKNKMDSNPDVLSIIRPIAQFMQALPAYTRQTNTLSLEARAVRDAFFKSKSPNALLFQELPQACGYQQVNADESASQQLTQFSNTLVKALRELSNAYTQLRQTLQQHIKTAFERPLTASLFELRAHLTEYYAGLESYTTDKKGLKAFIFTLIDSHGEDDQWLERIASFIAHAPSERWTDEQIYTVSYKLVEFAKHLTDLEQLRLFDKQAQHHHEPEFETTLLRSVRKGKDELYTIAYSNNQMRQSIKKTLTIMQQSLATLPDKEQRKAVIAELLNQELDEQGYP